MIDSKTVAKIARLAHIEVGEGEREPVGKELSAIFGWIEQLDAVKTDDVPMLASVSDTALPWRKDEITDGHCREAVLANAPASEYGCFVVPKVISDE